MPLHLRNAVGSHARAMGHGKGYVYAHDTEAGVAQMRCLPEELRDIRFYEPGDRGFEQRVAERMDSNDKLRSE